jgi:TIR domain
MGSSMQGSSNGPSSLLLGQAVQEAPWVLAALVASASALVCPAIDELLPDLAKLRRRQGCTFLSFDFEHDFARLISVIEQAMGTRAGQKAAFFSYSREDSDFALRLARDLKAAGASVWLDQLDIVAGQPWDRAIEDALTNCPSMLVILSPASVNSTNVTDEVSFALEHRKTVIPVMYRDCAIPFRLRRIQSADFRQDYAGALKELFKTLAPEQMAGGSLQYERERVAEEDRSRAAEQARLEDERRELAKRTRLEQERKQAAQRTRLEKEEYGRLSRTIPKVTADNVPPSGVDIFLSYQSSDVKKARMLVDAFQQEGCASRRLQPKSYREGFSQSCFPSR